MSTIFVSWYCRSSIKLLDVERRAACTALRSVLLVIFCDSEINHQHTEREARNASLSNYAREHSRAVSRLEW